MTLTHRNQSSEKKWARPSTHSFSLRLQHLMIGWILFVTSCWCIINISSYPDAGSLDWKLLLMPAFNSTGGGCPNWDSQKSALLTINASNVDRKEHNFTVAICLVVSDAEQYFQEWVDYHLIAMNFDNIYVYDNSKTFELARWYDNTRQHHLYSRVVIHHRPGKGTDDGQGRYLQAGVYEDCINQYGKSQKGPQHGYFALIDVDEFLVPQTPKYIDIHGILTQYLVPYGGALVSNWMLFGTANRTVYSPIPVTKRFQYRDAEPHHVVKSIVKASDFVESRNPHAVRVIHPQNVHTSEHPGAIQANVYNDDDKTKASSWVKASEVLLVHHYRYTSNKEYFLKRCIRGGLIGRWCDKRKGTIKSADQTPSHIQPRPGEVFDDLAWQRLTSQVPKYRIFDTSEWEDFM